VRISLDIIQKQELHELTSLALRITELLYNVPQPLTPRMDHAFRTLLRTATPRSIAALARDALGIFCGITLLWENYITFELSSGPSMYPTINTRGDYLLTLKNYKHGNGIEVGDVVRFHHPYFLGLHGGKRVLGLPGDFVSREDPLEGGAGGRGESIRVSLPLPLLLCDCADG
jgi:inner membrane protease subunit 1